MMMVVCPSVCLLVAHNKASGFVLPCDVSSSVFCYASVIVPLMTSTFMNTCGLALYCCLEQCVFGSAAEVGGGSKFVTVWGEHLALDVGKVHTTRR